MRPPQRKGRVWEQGFDSRHPTACWTVVRLHLATQLDPRRRLMNRTLKTLALSALTAAALTAHAQGSGPTDPQIAAIVVTANQVDIDAGKLAKSKAHSKQVKDFAQLMITDHTGVNKSASELVHKLNVKPEDNPTSESLKKGGDDNVAKLRTLKGADFDRAYVDHEVTYHEAVIDALDKTLIPNAKNEELKALMVKVRPAFVAHLEHAKQLQASLGKSGG
jgi:putative membrane protein